MGYTCVIFVSTFRDMSGLVPSIPKSTAFFCNVPNHVKNAILEIMPFEEGVLPVRYLGVPLITTRLVYNDCAVLVEKLDNRITNWKNKTLSFAGRLQLITSVLSSLHMYWASVFVLPTRIVHDLEKKMRDFLWSQGGLVKGKSKVAWDSICAPKFEGGLGIRKIEDMNKALMTSHIWRLVNNRESLWVKWVHSYKLKGRSFWEVPMQSSMSWGWRKLLQLRPIVRQFVWTKIGDGRSTSLWFDKWNSAGPLSLHISCRDIARAGLYLDSSVADVIEDESWTWPAQLLHKYPLLATISPPLLVNHPDSLIWCNQDGKELGYSASNVWDMIRSRHNEVSWVNVVWSSKCIPRHSFLLWLVMLRKLKTHDMMRPWDVGGAVNLNLVCCSLCHTGPDSHEHLFFQCGYSHRVWLLIREGAGMSNIPGYVNDIVEHLIPISKGNAVLGVIGRLVLASSVYFVWQERNQRMFSNKARTPEQLVEVILNTVRMRLATIKFRNSPKIARLLEQWRLPKCLLMDGDDPAYVE